jgi:hypothetical protein
MTLHALAVPLTPAASAEKKPAVNAVLTPTLDLWMNGGASLLYLACVFLLVPNNANTYSVSVAAFHMATLVNHPHFMASYSLLYADERAHLFTRARHIWAAWVVPVLLLGYMGWALQQNHNRFLGYAANAMYFFVGWHYVKQFFGTSIVLGVKNTYYFSAQGRFFLRAHTFPLWFVSFLSAHVVAGSSSMHGIPLVNFQLPPWTSTVAHVCLCLTSTLVAFSVVRTWVETSRLPPWPVWAGLAAIVMWQLPALRHPYLVYLIPFFHSLQYLLFVAGVKKRQYSTIAEATPIQTRALVVRKTLTVALLWVVTGWLFFRGIPQFLDTHVTYNKTLFGNEVFTYCAAVFINVHHYFIDNVIWRKDSATLKTLSGLTPTQSSQAA